MKQQLEYEYRYPAGSFDDREILRRARDAGRLGDSSGRVRWVLLVNHIYHMPGNRDVMLRVRDVYSGRNAKPRSLLTLKLPPDVKGGFEQEYETWVEDGEAARRISAALGLEKRNVMEKLRGTVQLPELGEIAFDLNPGLPAAMEIEGVSKRALDRMVSVLGLRGPPSKEMRSMASLEGQYAERYGVDGAALKARFRGEGRSLLFSDSAPIRDLIRGGDKRREFDREFSRQAKIAQRLRRPL